MEDRILKILREVNPSIEDYIDKQFVTDEVFDSIEIMEIVNGIEREFDIRISVEDIVPDYFESIDSLKELIEKSGN